MPLRHQSPLLVRLAAALLAALFLLASPARAEKKKEEPPPAAKKIKVKERPSEEGVYIYRNGKFIPLKKTELRYSGVWFGVALSVSRLAAGYLLDEDIEDLPVFQPGDYLAFYFKDVHDTRWYYYPMSRHPEVDFAGQTEAELWMRPEAWYPGFVAIGDAWDLSRLFGTPHRDNYHYAQGRVQASEVAFIDDDFILAQFNPDLELPLDKYLITRKTFMFDHQPGSGPVEKQLPEVGWPLAVARISSMKNFKAKQDRIRRFNERFVVHHLLEEVKITLQKGQRIDTGIHPVDPNYIRFLSEKDFDLLLKPGEADQKSRLPRECALDRRELPTGEGLAAYRVNCDNFAIRYTGKGNKPEVRLLGREDGTEITIVYSPLFSYEDRYRKHVEAGWTLYEDKKYAEAVAEYQKALEIIPNYPDALNNLAWLYATAEDKNFWKPREALKLAKKAAQYLPVKPHILDTLAEAYFVNGHLKEAEKYEKRAYAGVKELPEQHKKTLEKYKSLEEQYKKAINHLEIAEYENAIKELHFLLEKYPSYVRALETLSWTYATAKDKGLKQPDLALDLARTAYYFSPEDPRVLDTLAEALYASGQKKRALEFAEKAAYYAPHDDYYETRLKKMK
ncbi:MAG: tetratricopeptide repeat protein, partial [Deltaproteobacteria bacterium]|nr:tetratricopeptide repeat protein [Deltaproteobacteria bacterium]